MLSMTPKVVRLSHIALEVEDASRATEFYQELWGLEVTEQDKNNLFLRSDTPDHHTLALYTGAKRKIHHIGFEAPNRDELERLSEVLAKGGRQIVYGPGPSPDEPGVDRVIRFKDLDGHTIEVYTGMERVKDVYGPRNIKPQGLNHVVIRVQDLAKSEQFYNDVLGFRTSDWTRNFMTFLRCNANHHSLAILAGDPALDHVAFNVTDWNELSRGVKFLGENKVRRRWGPGRHGPGNNLFAYFFDPEGNIVEYTCEVDQVDDATWQPRMWEFGSGDLWKGPLPLPDPEMAPVR